MFSQLFHHHKMHLLALLGLFTDRNDGFRYPFILQLVKSPVVDSDLQIRGGGWGQSSRPSEKGEAQSQEKIFAALWASVWSKNEGGGGGPSPGSATDPHPFKDLKPEKGRSFSVSVKLPTYPSPNPTFCPK